MTFLRLARSRFLQELEELQTSVEATAIFLEKWRLFIAHAAPDLFLPQEVVTECQCVILKELLLQRFGSKATK